MATFFPDSMLKQHSELSLESVAGKLTYFYEQLHLLHWTTSSYAEHMALGGLYDYVHGFKDDVMEKLMGYANRKVRAFKIEPVSDGVVANTIVSDLISFAHELKNWAKTNNYDDVENLAQSLSGEAAKVRYLLTLS